MKKSKIFTKRGIALAGMCAVLGLAVFLNMKYTASDTKIKYMGDTAFVSADGSDEAVETAAKPESILVSEREKREKAYTEAEEQIAETLKSVAVPDEDKTAAVNASAELSKRKTSEAAIETVLAAKGFSEPLVVIGEGDVTVIVKCDSLLSSETVRIKDAVIGELGDDTANIKIVTVNS